jgi:AraC-like DNA-binding protein
MTDPRGVPLFGNDWVPAVGVLSIGLTSAWQEQLAQWVDVLADEAHHDRPDGGAYRMGVLMQCWAGLHRYAAAQSGADLPGGPSFSRVSEIVAEARRYVSRHLAEDLSLEQVSEQVDVSGEYLTRAFRVELGVPFHQYVIRQRLAHARRLLTEGDMPVTQVCLSSGFGSLSHFCRTFKRVFGQTPTSYRFSAGRHL